MTATVHRREPAEYFAEAMRLIGKRVCKDSGKPFKAGKHIALVNGVVPHELTGRAALTFADVAGQVEARRCTLYVENPDKYTETARDMLEEGVDPKSVIRLVSRQLTDLQALPDDTPERDEAIIAWKQLESDLGRIINGDAV